MGQERVARAGQTEPTQDEGAWGRERRASALGRGWWQRWENGYNILTDKKGNLL